MPSLRDSYEDILEVSRGADLLITHPITLAGPIVANVLKIHGCRRYWHQLLFSIYDPPANARRQIVRFDNQTKPDDCKGVVWSGEVKA